MRLISTYCAVLLHNGQINKYLRTDEMILTWILIYTLRIYYGTIFYLPI